MSKNKVTLDFDQSTGLRNISDLEDLKIPKSLQKKTIEQAEDLNKIFKKFRIKCWMFIFIPLGIIIAIVGFTVLPFSYKFVGFLLGFAIIGVTFGCIIYVSVKREKKMKKAIDEISEETDGVVRANPNYGTVWVRTSKGGRTQRIIKSVDFEVKSQRLETYLSKNRESAFNMGQFAHQHNPSFAQNNLPQMNSNPLYQNNTGPPMNSPYNMQPFPQNNQQFPPFPQNNQQLPPFGPLPQGMLRPNPHILDPNFGNPQFQGGPGIGNNQLPFPNNGGFQGNYKVTDNVPEYSDKQKY